MKEMNFTQGIKVLSLALLAAAALSSCEMLKKEETPAYRVLVNVGQPVPVANAGLKTNTEDIMAAYMLNPVEGATIYYYYSEKDYLARNNPFRVGSTNAIGRDEFTTDSEEDIWVYIEKDNINSLRYTHPDLDYRARGHSQEHMYLFHAGLDKRYDTYALLAPEIARLQLNVMHNGQTVKGAEVQLYFSQEAYEANIPAQQELEETFPSFGYPNEEAADQDRYPKSPEEHELYLSSYYKKATDENGIAYFNLLEPRRYWFRVTKDGLTNEAGTITIEEPLSSTSEATRSITVGIN